MRGCSTPGWYASGPCVAETSNLARHAKSITLHNVLAPWNFHDRAVTHVTKALKEVPTFD